MKFKRAIGGFLLSFVFLTFFAYTVNGVQWFFDNSVKTPDGAMFLGSISDAAQGDSFMGVNAIGISPVDLLKVDAKSAISVESNLSGLNKNIFEKDINIQLPIASLTKLMTAIVVIDNYKLSDIIVVDNIADSQPPMKQDVKVNDLMPVENFLDIMLVGSSNKAAYALAEGPLQSMGEEKFVQLMNKKAKDIGLSRTYFADTTGVSPENVSTAGDLAKLAEYILKNYPKISDISSLNQMYVPGFGEVTNTDQLLGEVPEVICSKTGFTNAAKGCLLLVMKNPKNNDYLINVVLGADDRFSEMRKIINWSSAMCD